MDSTARRVLLALLFAAPLSGADLSEIQGRASLRALVVIDSRRPEFFSLSPTSPGFDRELLTGFAQRHQLKLEVVALPSWDDLIPALLAHKGDIIVGGFRDTEARRKSVAFSAETFPTRVVVVTLRPHRVVETMADLRTEKVGVMKGTAMADAAVAAGVPPKNLDDGIAVGSYAEALHAGRITAGIWSIDRAIPAQREDPDLQLGMFLDQPGTLAFAVRKEDTQLLAAINDQIGSLRRSGAWSQLVVKYFGENALAILKTARTN